MPKFQEFIAAKHVNASSLIVVKVIAFADKGKTACKQQKKIIFSTVVQSVYCEVYMLECNSKDLNKHEQGKNTRRIYESFKCLLKPNL